MFVKGPFYLIFYIVYFKRATVMCKLLYKYQCVTLFVNSLSSVYSATVILLNRDHNDATSLACCLVTWSCKAAEVAFILIVCSICDHCSSSLMQLVGMCWFFFVTLRDCMKIIRGVEWGSDNGRVSPLCWRYFLREQWRMFYIYLYIFLTCRSPWWRRRDQITWLFQDDVT